MINRIKRLPKWIIDNKWKTLFGSAAFGYVAKWKYGDYLHKLSTAVELALEKGAEPAMGNKIDKVVVILNPVANGGFSVQAYEENAKPVFDCAGFDLTVKKTEYVKHERDIAMEIEPCDIIVIAGGDTCVQNVITGLNRRPDAAKFKDTKIGILPMGKTNKIWKNFSSGREDTWEIPYGRNMRITEAAKTIIDGHTKKANGLALTTDSGVTIYTMSGLRWGLYYDIEKRAEDYSLPPWWQTGKLMRSYFVSYLNGDFDDARSLQLKYTSPSSAEEIEKERKEKAEQDERFRRLASQYRGSTSFGFGRRKAPVPPPSETTAKEIVNQSEVDFDHDTNIDTFEINFNLNHEDLNHSVDIQSENALPKNSEWGSTLLFIQKLLYRKQDYGNFQNVNQKNFSVANFEIIPNIKDFDEDKRENSFYLDGESFIPERI